MHKAQYFIATYNLKIKITWILCNRIAMMSSASGGAVPPRPPAGDSPSASAPVASKSCYTTGDYNIMHALGRLFVLCVIY